MSTIRDMRLPTRSGDFGVAIVCAAVSSVAAIVAQDAMQLNVPYRCPDGATRTITRLFIIISTTGFISSVYAPL